MEQKYNYNEFLAFLLLYASHVDIEFSKEEKQEILSHVSAETYDRIYSDFDQMSDYEALQTVLSYKGLYYPTVEQKKEVLDKLIDLFHSDGEYSPLEKELHHFLDKLM